ncbi:MAG: malonyl-CoA decarboxylase [Minwuia sp.]|nr:malonyl-CoA decarboxylase [Minwuia sp.]
MSRQTSSFWTRTLSRLQDWRRDDVAGVRPLNVSVDLAGDDLETIAKQIDACLDGRGGAVSARLRAAELGRAYLSLDQAGRLRFFTLLAERFDVDESMVDDAARDLSAADNDADRVLARRNLRRSLATPRVNLFRQFNSLDRGVKFLVDMRADLLRLLRDNPGLQGVEDDLQDLLRAWFDVGFLEMAQITFNSPASLLEKLIAYEAVHEIQSWADLKNRLDSDRRCFSFVHPNMPDEPLIFVEVALVNGIADNVHDLLDEAAPAMDPEQADTAIFYSISNCQRGLAGVGFGDFLIKRVVDRLSKRMPNLKTFATLSPVPGFRRWLGQQLDGEPIVLSDAQARLIKAIARETDVNQALRGLLSNDNWPNDHDIEGALKEPLLALAARYLSLEKDSRGRPLDPVARFHLNNGARIERLNWLGDRSPSGLRQAAGMMVNYLYNLDHIERNHEAYRGEAKIAIAPAVSKLAR